MLLPARLRSLAGVCVFTSAALTVGLLVAEPAVAAPPPINTTAVVLTPTPNPVAPAGRVHLKAETPVAKTDMVAATAEQFIDRTKMVLTGIDDIVAPDGWTIYTSTDGGNTYTQVPSDPTTVNWSQVNSVRASGAVTSSGATPEGDQVSKSSGTGKPSTPIPGAIDTSGAGDGFQAFFDAGHTRLFNIPHHRNPGDPAPDAPIVDCHLLSDGSRCAGFPYALGVSANDISLGAVVGTKLWTVGTRQKPGQSDPKVGQMAFRCIDLADVLASGGLPKDCSTPFVIVDQTIQGTAFTPNVNFSTNYYDPTYGWQYSRNFTSGLAGVGFEGSATETKLWSYNTLTGLLTCADTATMTPCQEPGTDGWPIGVTPTSDISAYDLNAAKGDQSVLVSQGRVYVKAYPGVRGGWSSTVNNYKLSCVDTGDPTQRCPGFQTLKTAANGVLGGKLVELPNADGSIKGVCLLGVSVPCFDPTGTQFASSPTLVNPAYSTANFQWGNPLGWVTFPVRKGSRIYFSNGDGGILYNSLGQPTDNTWSPMGARLWCWDAARATTASTADAAGCMGPPLTP